MTQKLLLAIPAALSLAACGGGGDDIAVECDDGLDHVGGDELVPKPWCDC